MASTNSDKASVLGRPLDPQEIARGAAHLAWHMIELTREKSGSAAHTVTDSIILLLENTDKQLVATSEDAFNRSNDKIRAAQSSHMKRMHLRQESLLLQDASRLFGLSENARASVLRKAIVNYLPDLGTGRNKPSMQ